MSLSVFLLFNFIVLTQLGESQHDNDVCSQPCHQPLAAPTSRVSCAGCGKTASPIVMKIIKQLHQREPYLYAGRWPVCGLCARSHALHPRARVCGSRATLASAAHSQQRFSSVAHCVKSSRSVLARIQSWKSSNNFEHAVRPRPHTSFVSQV